MSNYPGAIDEFRTTQNLPGVLYNESDETTVYAEDTNSHSQAIVAIQTTLGVEPASAYPTVADRLDAISIGFLELFNLMYPVGTIYQNAAVPTNPGDMFGVGEWEPYGEGRVLVGVSPSGTFGTIGATGGAETVTLTAAQMPSHTHAFNNAQPFVRSNSPTYGYSPDNAARAVFVDGSQNSIASAGGGGAHNNLQPYVVVYIWVRIA